MRTHGADHERERAAVDVVGRDRAVDVRVFAAPLDPAGGETVAIDKDDIGGVVSGPKGPEAGVWVIAETRDLGVRYIKSVVTDDQRPLRRSRFAVREVPGLGARLWSGGQRQGGRHAGPAAQHHRRARAERGRGREVLPRDLLVLDAEDPRRRGVRRQGPRHCRAADRAAPMDLGDEEHRLHRLPSAGPAVHPHDPAVARHRSPPAPTPGSGACSRASRAR